MKDWSKSLRQMPRPGYQCDRQGFLKLYCRSKSILFFPRDIAPTFPSLCPRCAAQPLPPFIFSLLFFQMAVPKQSIDLGARSDTLEQVRCPQSGRVKRYTQAIPVS